MSLSFLHVRLPVHDQHLLILQQQVAVIVAEMVGVTVLGAVDVGEVPEVKACQLQHLPLEGGLALGAGPVQDVAVLAQPVVDLL
mgnify:CR=1